MTDAELRSMRSWELRDLVGTLQAENAVARATAVTQNYRIADLDDELQLALHRLGASGSDNATLLRQLESALDVIAKVRELSDSIGNYPIMPKDEVDAILASAPVREDPKEQP